MEIGRGIGPRPLPCPPSLRPGLVAGTLHPGRLGRCLSLAARSRRAAGVCPDFVFVDGTLIPCRPDRRG